MKIIDAWRKAKEDVSEPFGDLTEAEHGDPLNGPYVRHGWYVMPADWGLGVSADWERWQGRLRVSFTVELGPFAWTIDWYPKGDPAVAATYQGHKIWGTWLDEVEHWPSGIKR